MAQIQFAGSAPLVKQGKLRCLGVTSSTRTPMLPEVPTIAEQGIKGFQSYNWNGMLAPAATPKAIIARIQEVLAKQLKSSEARELYVGQGHERAAKAGRVRCFLRRRKPRSGQGSRKRRAFPNNNVNVKH